MRKQSSIFPMKNPTFPLAVKILEFLHQNSIIREKIKDNSN